MTAASKGPSFVHSTYVHLLEGGAASAIEVDERFWPDLMAGARPELNHGRLMTGFAFAAPWTTWEMHPDGEEVVLLLSGAATFTLELAEGPRAIALAEAGQFIIVPRGVWHTADTDRATSMLFITAGAGTKHRART